MSTVILSETKNPRGSVLNFYKPRPPFSVRDEIKPEFMVYATDAYQRATLPSLSKCHAPVLSVSL